MFFEQLERKMGNSYYHRDSSNNTRKYLNYVNTYLKKNYFKMYDVCKCTIYMFQVDSSIIKILLMLYDKHD